MQKKAVILLSGGLDSATCLAIAKHEGYRCFALSVCYEQKQQAELESAKKLAQKYAVEQHDIITVPIGHWGGSALTDVQINIPNHSNGSEIPSTYVPARNTIFLSIALSKAEILGAEAIYIGANAVDYSGYPDCRPDYFHAFQAMADIATKAGISGHRILIKTPLLQMSKSDIIKLGVSLGVDYATTVTCYRATREGLACGECESCYYRKKGFRDANIEDPTRYK